MRRALGVVAIAIVASARAGAEPTADALAEARRLEAALDYAGAYAVVDRALAAGGADPGRYVELELLAGKLSAGLDEPARATGHFARALAVRPALRLPDGTSPKLTAPFDAALARSVPLRLHATAHDGLVTLHLDADALGLVAGISVDALDAAGAHREVVAAAARRVALPAGARAVEVTALDARGNRLWTGEVAAPAVAGASGTRPWIARWPTWAAVAGGALVLGGVSAWRFQVAQDDWNELDATGTAEFSDLDAIERRGRRWGVAANVAFGVGAAAAITSTVFAIRGEDRHALRVTVGPSAGLGIAGAF